MVGRPVTVTLAETLFTSAVPLIATAWTFAGTAAIGMLIVGVVSASRLPLRYHSYVTPVPVAAMENVAGSPSTQMEVSSGCEVITGLTLYISVALLTKLPSQALVTRTQNGSDTCIVKVSVVDVAPVIGCAVLPDW